MDETLAVFGGSLVGAASVSKGCDRKAVSSTTGGDAMPLFSRRHSAALSVFVALLWAAPAHAADRQPRIPELEVEYAFTGRG